MTKLSQLTKKLIEDYQNQYYSLQKKERVETIHVDEIASRVATFYEKIRGIIDWRGEHLLRRMTIERILKRRLFLEKKEEEIANSLVLELIRGGYLPNDEIEKSKIKEIEKIINKYLVIFKENSNSLLNKIKIQFYNWILGIAACEIEETLLPFSKEKSLIEYMTKSIEERIDIEESTEKFSKEDKNIQIYIAVQKALFDFDPIIIAYNLLKKKYPDWRNLSDKQLIDISKNIYSIWNDIEKKLTHPLGDKFYQICEKYDTPYLILGDIISKNPFEIEKKIIQPEILENLIKQAYNERYKTLKLRIRRAALFATLSIFIGNMLSLYTIEIFFIRYVLNVALPPLALIINILGPTFLMFLLITTIKLPPKENLSQAIIETIKITYETKKKDKYKIKSFFKKKFGFTIIVTIIYVLSFFFSYGLIILGLRQIALPIPSQVTFVIFVSLIAFAGIKIRRRAKELHMVEEKEGFLYFILDVISVPITYLGKWLSNKWKKYNILALLFSSLIDMPFQIFIEFLEHWRSFLREQKEKIH